MEAPLNPYLLVWAVSTGKVTLMSKALYPKL